MFHDSNQQHVDPNKRQFCPRLSAQLQQVTFQELQLKVEKDLGLLQAWAEAFETFAAQQGLLDMKFISDHFQRGKISVSKFMEEQQIYNNVNVLQVAHGDIVNKQAKHGNKTLLVSITSPLHVLMFFAFYTLRLTIMIIDCSQWLSSSLNGMNDNMEHVFDMTITFV